MACAATFHQGGAGGRGILQPRDPTLRIRVLNVSKLFALCEAERDPHGCRDRDFDSLVTTTSR